MHKKQNTKSIPFNKRAVHNYYLGIPCNNCSGQSSKVAYNLAVAAMPGSTGSIGLIPITNR
jgi:hypothetical protein